MHKISSLSKIGISVLLLFHTIGIVIILQNPTNAEMSWINLVLCALLIYLPEDSKNKIWVFFMIAVGGYTVELIGVHTGLLFGNYQYESALGTKLFSVPLVIGANWFCVVLSSSNWVRKVSKSLWIQALLSAALCTGLDILIEPVAIRYGFWSWSGPIPTYNYVCWFFFSFVFALVYLKSSNKTNYAAMVLYPLWVIFFLSLNFL